MSEAFRREWAAFRARAAAAAPPGLSLFAPSTRARRTDPATSHAAAHAQDGAAQRAAILAQLAAGPMTADELDAALAWRPTTAGRRMRELWQLGLVRGTGQTRPTRSGRSAEVWAKV